MAKNTSDIKDSKRDEKELEQDSVTLDLPDVKDIPGQENVVVPKMGEMADTTISSDDEEGVGLFNDAGNADAGSERVGAASLITEDDLMINGDDDKAEEELDEEDEVEDEDLDITDDSVDPDSDVSDEEKLDLERTANDVDTYDNEDAYNSELDDTDLDGDKLNEDIDLTGDDLDVPGSEDDDSDEEIGEEDEENNDYSLGDNK